MYLCLKYVCNYRPLTTKLQSVYPWVLVALCAEFANIQWDTMLVAVGWVWGLNEFWPQTSNFSSGHKSIQITFLPDLNKLPQSLPQRFPFRFPLLIWLISFRAFKQKFGLNSVHNWTHNVKIYPSSHSRHLPKGKTVDFILIKPPYIGGNHQNKLPLLKQNTFGSYSTHQPNWLHNVPSCIFP